MFHRSGGENAKGYSGLMIASYDHIGRGSMTPIIVGRFLQHFNDMTFVKVTLPVVSDEDCNAAYGAAG